MGEHFDLSYCELRCKEVINTADGRRLGRIVDIVFSSKGDIKGIVVPFCKRVFFTRSQEVFIPWKCIDRIGEDVILVCLIEEGFSHHGGRDKRHDKRREYCPPNKEEHHDKKDKHHDDHHDHRDHYDNSCYGDFDNYYEVYDDFHGHDHKGHHDKKEKGNKHSNECHDDKPKCDRKCEKCMLFDCAFRWKK